MKHAKEKTIFKEDSGRGYRRVVPSPVPIDVIEKESIKNLVNKGVIVIACGGGGMPVYKEKNGTLEGLDGVVDKDLASALLANELNVNCLAILTSVDYVYKNFGKDNEEKLEKIKLNDAKKLLTEGHFKEGSMKPKIQAAINFLEKNGKKVIITGKSKLCSALEGKSGTIIVR